MLNKPNLQFYKGQDLYSDGDIEEIILKALESGHNEEQILSEHFCFVTYYHFSKIRRNLLSWYDFKDNCDMLEIGSGLGAITGLLAEKAGSLTCVELSLRRSTINYYRNINKSNIDILAGDLADITFDKKFDYITLIGVLEYIQLFNQRKSFELFLRGIKKLLKPNGQLIVAIENKFGLKYFAGAKEDHIGLPYKGIEGYGNYQIRTFGKKEITNLLLSAGFKNIEFYYPYPDYKFPQQIFNDIYPEYFDLSGRYDDETGYCFEKRQFSEYKVLKELKKEELFGSFANSFLIFAE